MLKEIISILGIGTLSVTAGGFAHINSNNIVNAVEENDIVIGNGNIENTALMYCLDNSGKLTVKGNTDMNGSTVIPSLYFDFDNNITTVEILDGVTAIGDNAFEKSVNIISITLANSVTKISENAFKDCYNLKSITISENVKSIADNAFKNVHKDFKINCYKDSYAKQYAMEHKIKYNILESNEYINLENTALMYKLNDNGNLTITVNENNIDGSKTILSCYFNGNDMIKNIEVLDGITEIGCYAFKDCENLEKVSCPNVIKIDKEAFKSCKNLKSIECPNVINIGEYAFYKCYNLDSIDCPKVKSIAEGAFHWCKALSLVKCDNIETIGKKAFYGCQSLRSITLPNSLKYIDSDEKESVFGEVATDFIINCQRGSYAKQYAKEYNIEINHTK